MQITVQMPLMLINRKLSYPFTKESFKFCHAWLLLGSYHSEITTTVYCKILSNTDILDGQNVI
jgi:hypothetical protein